MSGGVFRWFLVLLAAASLAVAGGFAVLSREGTPDPVAVQPTPPPPPVEVPDGLPLLRARLRALADSGQFTGAVLVAQGDRVLLRQAYGPASLTTGAMNAPDSRFRLASDSKQFTAAAILRLQDEGRLSVNDPVCRFIDPCPVGWETIRLSHLMSHTSGLPDLMDRPNWGELRQTPQTLAQLTADTMQYRPRFTPGTRADYNNAGFNLLAEVVQRVSGMPFETFLQQAFFEPLGMVNTGSDVDAQGHGVVEGFNRRGGQWVPGPTPNVSIIAGAGALYSTVDDILIWERALHGGRVLSPASYAQMIADHAPVDQGLRPGARPRGWGFGLMTSDLGSGADPQFQGFQVYHTGSWAGFRNMISHMPRGDVTAIVLTNDYDQRDQVFLITQQAMAEATGAPFPTGLQQ